MDELEKWLTITAVVLLAVAVLKSGIFGKVFYALVQAYPSGNYVRDITIVNPIVDKAVNKTILLNYRLFFSYHGNEVYEYWGKYGYARIRSIYPSGYSVIKVDNITRVVKLFDYEACTGSDEYRGCERHYTVRLDITNFTKGIHNMTIYVFLPSRGYWVDPDYCGISKVIGVVPPEGWEKYGGRPTSRCQSIYDYLSKMSWDRIVRDIETGNFTKMDAMRIERFDGYKFVVCEYGECIEPRIIQVPVEKQVIVEKPYIPTYVYIVIGALVIIIAVLVSKLVKR
jgi:hypothetical protein